MEHNLSRICRTKRHQRELITHANPILVQMLLDLYRFCNEQFPGRQIQISSLYRSLEEQEALYQKIRKTNPYYSGPRRSAHSFGNACDLSRFASNGIEWDSSDRNKIITCISKKYDYGMGKPSIYWHTGTAPHFHLQVNYRRHGIGFDPTKLGD